MTVIWDPARYLIETASYKLSWYEVFYAAGLVTAYLLLRREYRRFGMAEDVILELAIVSVPVFVFMSHAVHMIFYEWPELAKTPAKIWKVHAGGYASHGAALGVIATNLAWARVRGFKASEVMDRYVPAALVGSCFIRLGNLWFSEIVGRTTDMPWAFRFVHRDGPLAMPRHPVQLYEALNGLVFAALVYWVFHRTRGKWPPWLPTAIYLFGFFGLRFLLEFFKEYQVEALERGGLMMGQWLSLPFMAVGLALLIKIALHGRTGHRRNEPVATGTP